MPRTARFAVPVFVASFALGGVVVAQQNSGRPVLHEFFVYTQSPPTSDEGALPTLPEPGRAGAVGADGTTPANDVIGPDAGLTLTPGGPVASPGFFQDQSGGLRNGPPTSDGDVTLDDQTEPEGMLRYAEVFDPSVLPWKRSSARDTVSDDSGTLSIGVRDRTGRPVSIGGAPPEGSDRFTGSFAILASPGVAIPIPSVAPNMVVHTVELTPPANVAVTRDSADNFFLTVDQGGAFDVVMEVSAPRSYFGGPLPANGAALGPPLVDADLGARISPMLETIGVHRGMNERVVLTRLVEWFRGFEARPLPADQRTGDLYVDITRLQSGVCRHRAQAFVITAAALGLPARYVHNEAHAFVEVRLAGTGWRRVDLGGASAGLEIYGNATSQHTPLPDPLPQPAANREPYHRTRPVGDPDGENASGTHAPGEGAEPGTSTERQRGDEQELRGHDGEQGEDGESREPGEHGESGGGDAQQAGGAPYEGSGLAIEVGNTGATGGTGGEGGPPPTPAARTQLVFSVSARRGYRGEPVTVAGTLDAPSGASTAGRPVRVLLTREDGVSVTLGTAETDGRGGFALEATIPPAAFAGAWDLRVQFAGDEDLLASEAR